MSTRKLVLLMMLVAVLVGAEAQAGVLLASSRVNNPFSYTFAPGFGGTSNVPLDDAGNTSKTFNLPAAGTVVITVSAECWGSSSAMIVAAVVTVDGVNIATGDGGSPLHYTRWCQGGSSPEVVTRTVYRALSAGNHTVQFVGFGEATPFTGPYTAQFEKIVITVTN